MFIFKQKIAGKTVAGGIRDVEIMMSLKYSTNFWRTLEMFLIDCEINLILTWSAIIFNKGYRNLWSSYNFINSR